MKKYLTEIEIRELFSCPVDIRKGIELWENAGKKTVINNDTEEEQELKINNRRRKIREEKRKIKENEEHMNKLYKEDKQLTEITKSLENEDFHEYQ